ncbi:hypothetical protein SAVIM40S_06397 [Streptomyces avidinii]|uniref:DUF397 domain-containing protein n=1 Tax=Streptomyces avidinii TaxID=1895 RepID=A0ABS4L288_STRAV|nr:DUF397 domain-containing protein [Streptomyces avidinii]MBP2036385.1 hypothetical protein [Streptomyces avidinii]
MAEGRARVRAAGVEVAHTPGTVLVRDSKRPEYARLAVGPGAWTGFVAHAVTS